MRADVPVPVSLTGRRIGSYEIVEAIGRGGMGEVYRAWDTRLRRVVAIKTLPQASLGKASARRRFLRETRIACRVVHPYVATVFDVVEEDERLFLVMEYIEGRRLDHALLESPASGPEMTRIALEIAESLAAIHKAGLVHRDLKPGNIMLTPDGHVKVMDFGVAYPLTRVEARDPRRLEETIESTVTGPGMAVGTIAYMSPEQVQGREVDPRSDQFSLGIVLYEAITHQHPFARSSALATASAIVNEPPGSGVEPETLTQSGPLREIVRTLLEKDPSDRYSSSEALVADLRAAERGEAPPRRDVARVERRTRGRWLGAAAVALSLTVAVLAYRDWSARRTSSAIAPGGDRPGVVVLAFGMPSSATDGPLRGRLISSMLRADLAQSDRLRVVGATRTDEIVGAPSLDPVSAAASVRRALRATSSRFGITGTVSQDGGTTLAAVEVFDAENPEATWAVREQASGLTELVDRLTAKLATGIAPRLGSDARGWSDRPVAELASASEAALLAAERGQDAFTHGDLSAAEREYAAAVETDSSFVRAHMARGRALYAAGYVGRAREAVADADRAAGSTGRRLPARTRLELDALRARVGEDRKGEETALRKILDADPGDAETWSELAATYLSWNRPDDALQAIGEAERRSPNDPAIALRRSEVLRRKGQPVEAEKALAACEALMGAEHGGPLFARYVMEQGYLATTVKKFKEARDRYTEAARYFEASGEPIRLAAARAAIAKTYLLEGRFEEAEGPLESAARDYATAGNVRVEAITLDSLGALLMQAGKLRRAEAVLTDARTKAESVGSGTPLLNPLINSATLLNLEGRGEEARALAERALSLARATGDVGRQVSALSQLAETKVQDGRFEAANEDLAQLLTLLPKDRPDHWIGWTWVSIADLRAHRGQLRDAAAAAEQAIAAQRDVGQPFDLAYALLERARLSRIRGDLTGMTTDLASAESQLARAGGQQVPADFAARLALERGLAATEADRRSEGEVQLSRALSTEIPTAYVTARARGALGILLCRHGEVDRGLSEARRGVAVAMSRLDRAVARCDLADALAIAGRFPEAIREARACLEAAAAMPLPWETARAAGVIGMAPAADAPADIEDVRAKGREALRLFIDGAQGTERDGTRERPDVRRLSRKLGIPTGPKPA